MGWMASCWMDVNSALPWQNMLVHQSLVTMDEIDHRRDHPIMIGQEGEEGVHAAIQDHVPVHHEEDPDLAVEVLTAVEAAPVPIVAVDPMRSPHLEDQIHDQTHAVDHHHIPVEIRSCEQVVIR